MANRFYCITSALFVAALFTGCVANQPVVQAPSFQEVEWANQVIALDTQQKALQKRELDLKRRELEVTQKQAQADLEMTNAMAKAWLAQNKDQIEKQLTDSYKTNAQQMLESFGFNGTILDYAIEDVALDDNVFTMSQLFLWKNSDDTGEIARINVGYDLKTGAFVGSNIVGTKHFAAPDLAALVNGDTDQNNQQVAASAPPAPTKLSSVWSLNNETVNSWYKVVGAVAIPIIVNKLAGLMDDNSN